MNADINILLNIYKAKLTFSLNKYPNHPSQAHAPIMTQSSINHTCRVQEYLIHQG